LETNPVPIAEQFWMRWRKEYIQNLQPRRKWLHQKPSLKTGDVVLVRNSDEEKSLANWPGDGDKAQR
jgi:hypothetical protein